MMVNGFGVSTSQKFQRLDTPYAAFTSTTLRAEQRGGTRRGFIAAVKRLLLGTGFFSTSGGLPVPALAEETDASGKSGNVVEIQVTNVDGESDSKGTIKIQLKPEWAPRGVARFEVRAVWCRCQIFLCSVPFCRVPSYYLIFLFS
jgi:hypothetical protein